MISMIFYKKHLHYTWLISVVLMFSTILFSSPIPYAFMSLLFIFTCFWVLHRKERSFGWILIPISIILLPDKRVKDNEIWEWESSRNYKIAGITIFTVIFSLSFLALIFYNMG